MWTCQWLSRARNTKRSVVSWYNRCCRWRPGGSPRSTSGRRDQEGCGRPPRWCCQWAGPLQSWWRSSRHSEAPCWTGSVSATTAAEPPCCPHQPPMSTYHFWLLVHLFSHLTADISKAVIRSAKDLTSAWRELSKKTLSPAPQGRSP